MIECVRPQVMVQYVATKEHLQSAMVLMKNESAAICHEAFHIFKIFVANPKKSRNVHVILYQNKQKLIAFFEQFLSQKAADDEEFKNERKKVVQYIVDLEAPPPDLEEQKSDSLPETVEPPQKVLEEDEHKKNGPEKEDEHKENGTEKEDAVKTANKVQAEPVNESADMAAATEMATEETLQ